MQLEQRPSIRYQSIYDIYAAEVPIEPLRTRARLAVVVLREENSSHLEPFFVVTNFRSKVLSDHTSEIFVSDESFSRVLKGLAVPHVYCDSKNERAELLHRLKAHQVLGSNCSKAKLAALHGLQPALARLKLRPSVVGQLVKMMFSLVPPTVPIPRPGELRAVAAPPVAAAAAATAVLPPPGPGLQHLLTNLGAAPGAGCAGPSQPGTSGGHPASELGLVGDVASTSGAAAAAVAAVAAAAQSHAAAAAAAAAAVGAANALAHTEVPAATLAAKEPRLPGNLTTSSNAATAWAASLIAGLVPQYENKASSEPLPRRLPHRCYSPLQLYGDYGIQVHIPDW